MAEPFNMSVDDMEFVARMHKEGKVSDEQYQQVMSYAQARLKELQGGTPAGVAEDATPGMEAINEEEPGMLESLAEEVSGAIGKVIDNPLKEFDAAVAPLANGVIKAINETIQMSYDVAEAVNLIAPGAEVPALTTFDDGNYKDRAAAKMAEDVTRLVAGFAGANKVLSPIKAVTTTGQFTKATVAGAISDFTVMNPHEKRISNFINEHTELGGVVTEYLAADEDDSALLGRVKNAAEGAGLGALVEGFTRMLQGTRSLMKGREASKTLQAVDDVTNPEAVVKPKSEVRQTPDIPEEPFDVATAVERHTDAPGVREASEKAKQDQINAMWDDYYSHGIDKDGDYAIMEMQAKEQNQVVERLKGIKPKTDAERELAARANALAKGEKPIKVDEMDLETEFSVDRIEEFTKQLQEAGKVTDRQAKERAVVEMGRLSRDHKFMKENNLSGNDFLDDWTLERGVDGHSLRMETETAIARGDISGGQALTLDEQVKLLGKGTSKATVAKVREQLKNEAIERAVVARKAEKEQARKILAEEMPSKVDEFSERAKTAITAASKEAQVEEVLRGARLYNPLTWARGIGKMGEHTDRWFTEYLGKGISRPQHKLEVMGNAGRALGKMMRQTELNIEGRMGRFTASIRNTVGKLSEAEQRGLAAVVRGEAKATSKAQSQLAQDIRKQFDGVIDEAEKVGIYTKEQAQAVKAKRDYWPRVYNITLLESKAGQEKWVESFSNNRWSSEKSIRNALEHILHGDQEHVGQYMKLVNKEGKQYTMSKKVARKLYEHRDRATAKARSGHLEKERTLSVENEALLDPFLVKDPKAALVDYFHDVSKRIEMAKSFGAKDEVAEHLFRAIDTTVDVRDGDFARNVYFKLAGDSRSSMIAQQVNASQTTKRLLGKIDAIETLKLSSAQVLNAGQALINGTTYLSKHVGTVKAFRIAIGNIMKPMTREGREFAARSGAASEATIMEMAAEAARPQVIIDSKLLRGKWNPLQYINDPTKFLQATQFIRVENFNRSYAANMGRAYFEDILDKKATWEAGTRKLSTRQLAKLKRSFNELNIPFDTPVLKLTEDEVGQLSERAALAFSDTVNFRNTATSMPYLWNSPYMRLTRKFKTFAFNHGAFVKKHVIGPAVNEGNFAPLMTYMGVGGAYGMSVVEFKRWMKGDDDELTNTERYLKGMTAVGGIGIALDSITGLGGGYTTGVAGVVGGPAGADVVKAIEGGMRGATAESGQRALAAKRAIVRQAAGVTGQFPGKQKLLEEIRKDMNRKKATRRRARRRSRGSKRER